VTESTKGGFLFGMLVGVAAGVLLAPRHAKRRWPETSEPESAGSPWKPDDDHAAALTQKIEETRRRLREQMESEAGTWR